MKKHFIFCVLFSVGMTCGAQTPWNGTIAEAYDGGDGTPETPYQIATAEQLALLAYETNNGNGSGGSACYILTNDINLNGSEGMEWPTIGLMPNEFMGVFDGNGFTVSDMLINDHNIAGFFGTAENATIRHVRLSNAAIYDYGLPVTSCTGFLVGHAINTNIIDCSVDGDMDCFSSKQGGVVGYFVASNNNDTVFIRNCVNNANLFSYNNVGGIVGYTDSNYGTLCIEGCVNHGNLLDGSFCGGIVGQGSFYIKDCENYGRITSTISAGGIVGEGDWNCALIEHCTNRNKGEIESECAGGIIGTSRGARMLMCVNEANITGKSAYMIMAGGLAGTDGSFSNCYNRGNVSCIVESGNIEVVQLGGITGTPTEGYVINVYNTGAINKPDNPHTNNAWYGIIIPGVLPSTEIKNCYWYGDYEVPPCSFNSHLFPGNTCCVFNEGASPTTWILDVEQYGTIDLIEALNAGAMEQCAWIEDENGMNNGFPIFGALDPNRVEESVENQFNVYPNPTNDVLFVQALRATSLQTGTIYRITNFMGQTLLSGHIISDNQPLDVSSLPVGMYLLTIDGTSVKFVVQ